MVAFVVILACVKSSMHTTKLKMCLKAMCYRQEWERAIGMTELILTLQANHAAPLAPLESP